jgi:mono/diheme cytochrome c family protein
MTPPRSIVLSSRPRFHAPIDRLLLVLLLATAWMVPGARAAGQGKVDFNRDIRPLLADYCYQCHGPDQAKRKAGLRLDQSEGARVRLDSGHHAIVPGNPADSRLLAVVTSVDPDDQMPPAKTGKRLSSDQVELLRRWIREGAEWKAHWAYITPEKPEVPAVRDAAWPRNAIDQFILARLEKEGLPPSPEADRRTLARRVTLDLTGLPPTVEEVDAFLADTRGDAYEKLVDRLLATEAYGERMAVPWLDLARFADSDGYHADAPRSMWQYRDWVIRAFVRNQPFDQFVTEQIAGDLLPGATLDQRIATAFNRNGMSSTEGGADPEEYLNKYVTDRVNTFGTVFLGSSIQCAE